MSNEIVLTQEQQTILAVRLEGARIFKKKDLTKGETEEITDGFYAEVESALKLAEEKVAAEAKAREDMRLRNESLMMPHDRLNKFPVTAKA